MCHQQVETGSEEFATCLSAIYHILICTVKQKNHKTATAFAAGSLKGKYLKGVNSSTMQLTLAEYKIIK